MGFTPLEGLVMGTRCGWIDPAIPLHLINAEGFEASHLYDQLNKKSGILGITERYSDRRDIEQAAANGDERCLLALSIETYSIKKIIGSYVAALGGVDAVIFTAGVGEHSALIRERSLSGLECLGIFLDQNRNRRAIEETAKNGLTKRIAQSKSWLFPLTRNWS